MVWKVELNGARETSILNATISYDHSFDKTKNNHMLYVSRMLADSGKLTINTKYILSFEITHYNGELCTNEIPHINEAKIPHLDIDGFPHIGQTIRSGEIIVGIVRNKSREEMSPEERLLVAIFGDKATSQTNISIMTPDYLEVLVDNIEKIKDDSGNIVAGNITLIVQFPLSVGDVIESESGTRAIVTEICDLPTGIDMVSTSTQFFGTVTRRLYDSAKYNLFVQYNQKENYGISFWRDSFSLNYYAIEKLIGSGFLNELQNAINISVPPIDKDIKQSVYEKQPPKYPIYNEIFTKQIIAYLLALGVKLDFCTNDASIPATLISDDFINRQDLKCQVGAVTNEFIDHLELGEIKSSESINYGTNRIVKQGLFCEKVFGPQKNYECQCGRYKHIRNVGKRCEKCGVIVDHSSLRYTSVGVLKMDSSFPNPVFPDIELKQFIVIPPMLRPFEYYKKERQWWFHPLNNDYRKIINRSLRYSRLLELIAPKNIIENEELYLKQHISQLYNNDDRNLFSDFYDFVSNRFLKPYIMYSAKLKPILNAALNEGVCKISSSVAVGLFFQYTIHNTHSTLDDIIKEKNAILFTVSSNEAGQALALKPTIGDSDAIELSTEDYQRLGIGSADDSVYTFVSPIDIDSNSIKASLKPNDKDKKAFIEFISALANSTEISSTEKRHRVLSWIKYIQENPEFTNSLIFCYLTGRTPPNNADTSTH